jgi:hypothetical protein
VVVLGVALSVPLAGAAQAQPFPDRIELPDGFMPEGITIGTLVTLTSGDFDVPTTVAAFGNSLYLPNARFGVENPETADYWITRIDRH